MGIQRRRKIFPDEEIRGDYKRWHLCYARLGRRGSIGYTDLVEGRGIGRV